jgi:hypothetical protein
MKMKYLALLLFIGLVSADTGLVVYYNMSNSTGGGSGTTAIDGSGNLNNLTITGNNWTTGMNYQSPYALLFNGTSLSYAKTQNNINITGSSSRTMSLWVKLTSTSATQAIAGFGNNATNGNFYAYALGGYWYFNYFGSDMYFGAVSTSWTHLVATYDGTTLKVYVNSALVNSTAVALNSPNANLSVGYRLVDNSSWLNGTVDEIKVWNRTLTATEILTEYTKYCPLGIGSYIIAYNESSTSQPVGFDFTASNTTNLFIYNGVAAGFWTNYYCNSTFPIGAVTITISNTSFYSPRRYTPTLTLGGTLATTAYLLPLNDLYANPTMIYVKDSSGGSVAGASVSVYKQIALVWTMMAQDTTDSLGGTYFNLDSQTMYELFATDDCCATASLTLQPTQPVYTITLVSNTSYNTTFFNESLWGVSWSVTPTSYLVTGLQNFTFTINDTSNGLAFWGMNISYNGTVQYSTNQTAAGGGTVNFSINDSQVDSNGVNMTIFFYKNGVFFDPTYNYRFYSINTSQYSLVNAMLNIGNSTLSPFTKGIIAAVMTTVVVGYVGTAVSFSGGVVLAVLMMWAFVGINYMSYLPVGMLTIVGIAVIYNRHF